MKDADKTRAQLISELEELRQRVTNLEKAEVDRLSMDDLTRTQLALALALSAAQSLDESLRQCVEAAISVSGMDCGGVYLVDENTGSIDLAFHTGLPRAFVERASHYEADSPHAQLILTGKPIYSQHQELGLPLEDVRRSEGLRAIAVIPVHHESRVIACLNIASHTLDEVRVSARTMLETIAAQIGSSIARINAREALLKAHDDLEQRVEERNVELVQANEQLRQQITEHKRAEEELRESEERFRKAFDYAALGMVLVSPGGRFLKVNSYFCQMVGYTEEELLNRTFNDVTHPDDYHIGLDVLSQVVDGIVPYAWVEKRYLHKDGRIVWGMLSTSALRDAVDNVVYLVSHIQDITERRRAEQALRESNETLRAIINASPLAILAIDPHSKVTMWNPAAESIFGWTDQEVLGQYLPLVPPDKSVEHHDLRQRAFQGEKLTGIEAVRQKKDGTSIDVSLSTAPVNDAEGNVKSIMAVLEDITERKRAEDFLRESEQRYSSLFKNNHSVMLLIDPESADIVDANPAACSFYGWSQKELTSKKITDINVLTNEQVFQEMERARSAQHQHFYFSHRLASEEVRDVEVYSGPIMLHGKQLLYSIIHDISKRKQAEEELRRAHAGLEQQTAELVKLNETLKQEIEARKQIEQKLRKREAELKIQASELEELNTALRVLLKRREEDKVDVEEKTLSNVKELVLPYIERLRRSGLDDKQTTYVGILESNLNDIVSPLSRRLSSKYLRLTPTEIQIANLVKKGKTTKEIAEILHSSARTVEFHRNNIRKKIGIKNSKANLRSHLLSM
jgi:PAS domain S-box-containing protein